MASALKLIDNVLKSLEYVADEDNDEKLFNQVANLRIDCGNCDLRFIQEKDADNMVIAANSKLVVKYLRDRFPHPYTLNNAKWWINRVQTNIKQWEEKGFCDSLCLQIVDKKDVIIGGIGIERDEYEGHKYELGYWLNENYWNQSITTNAVRGLIDFVWNGNNKITEKLNLDKIVRIEAFIAAQNIYSSKVVTKCGFKQEGFHRKAHKYRDGTIGDQYSFAIIKEDYVSIS